MKKFLTLLMFFLFLFCSKNEECFTPPPDFKFTLIDGQTSENLITNGTLSISDIKLYKNNELDSSGLAFSEDAIAFFSIQGFGWQTETINYEIKNGNQVLFSFFVSAERVNDGCSYTKFNLFEISNDFENNLENGIYNIKID